jgi:hypothetical protein
MARKEKNIARKTERRDTPMETSYCRPRTKQYPTIVKSKLVATSTS